MKALLAEYTIFHDPELAPEGEAMLGVLRESFERCGYQVVSPEGIDFLGEITRLASFCDFGLVIAPDHLLSRFTAAIEKLTHNLGCGSMNVAVCANKRQTSRILGQHGIPVPEEVQEGRRVIKPDTGCGSIGVRLGSGPLGEGEFGQRYIEGEHFSVSLVGSRLVGDACLYYSGNPPLVLALNRQHITIDDRGHFCYQGGETPVNDHKQYDEIVAVAQKAVSILGCQGYTGVDIVLADRPYVVDVNPRITTSIVGIVACMEEEIADILIRASRGEAPETVHFKGKIGYDRHGRVISP
ncbi:MAG TPA: ATP-grasp domain-containing protein [Methanoregulaceae archaeon]|nr:ATP-grasp domain-containing protein [Methanoregulaceae archaeon]